MRILFICTDNMTRCPKDFYLSVLDTIEKACDGIVSKISRM